MGTRSTPGGNLQTGSPGDRKGCVWGLEARQVQEDLRSDLGRCPRLSPASGGAPGSASHRRLTSLPSGWPGPRAGLEVARAAHPRSRIWFRSQIRPPLPPALRFAPSETLAPDRPPRLPPAAFTCPGSGRRRRGRARVVEGATRGRGYAALSRRRRCALRRGAGLASSGGRRVGGNARRAPGRETLPLSVRPGKSSLTAASRDRAGGKPNGEGSRGAGNGCHVVQVDRRSPPSPHPPAPSSDLWFVPELRRSVGPPTGPTLRPGPPDALAPPSSLSLGSPVPAWPLPWPRARFTLSRKKARFKS